MSWDGAAELLLNPQHVIFVEALGQEYDVHGSVGEKFWLLDCGERVPSSGLGDQGGDGGLNRWFSATVDAGSFSVGGPATCMMSI